MHIHDISLIATKQLGYSHLLKNELPDNKSFIYCALNNKEVLGYVIGKLFSNASFFNSYKKLNTINTREIKKNKILGMLVSIAVKSKHQNKGIGTKLVIKLLKKFRENNAGMSLMTAWKSKNGVSMHKIADRIGYKAIAEVGNYWKEDSQIYGYHCPECGSPPCKCACVVYVLKF